MLWNSVSSSVSSDFPPLAPPTDREITLKLTPFDRSEYRSLIRAREKTIRDIVQRITFRKPCSTVD